MGNSRDAESERARRQLKIELPPELKLQIKKEAVDLDIALKRYVQRILENRLPWRVMDTIEARAKQEGLEPREFVLRILRQAGVLDE